MYVYAILSGQLQNEESNSLEQRLHEPIKKRQLIQNGEASFNSHYGLNQHEHEQSMWIKPNDCNYDTTNRQKHRKCCQTTPMHIVTHNRYTSIIVVMATHLLAIPIVTSVEIQRYLAFILVLSVEQMDI